MDQIYLYHIDLRLNTKNVTKISLLVSVCVSTCLFPNKTSFNIIVITQLRHYQLTKVWYLGVGVANNQGMRED